MNGSKIVKRAVEKKGKTEIEPFEFRQSQKYREKKGVKLNSEEMEVESKCKFAF